MRYKESKTFLSEEQKRFLEWICSKQSNIPWYWEPNAAEPDDGGHHFIPVSYTHLRAHET